MLTPRQGSHKTRAFSLLEVLLAMAVLAMLLAALAQVVGQASLVTRRANAQIEAFQGARTAFDLMTATLSQTTLNNYWDYDDPADPAHYLRVSDLHFLVARAGDDGSPGSSGSGHIVAFQYPGGSTENSSNGLLHELLNASAFYVDYGPGDALPPPFDPPSQPVYRYRLKQWLQVAEKFKVYSGEDWLVGVEDESVPVADNVILLLVWPRRPPAEDPVGNSLTNDYSYDTRRGAEEVPQPETAHQLPPVVQITMVAIDEPSAARICAGAAPPAQITSALDGLFLTSTREEFEKDLAELEGRLAQMGVEFRTFSTMVPLRESKMQ